MTELFAILQADDGGVSPSDLSYITLNTSSRQMLTRMRRQYRVMVKDHEAEVVVDTKWKGTPVGGQISLF